ncbi:ead/Ea22-like family protein [Escherichia coli]|uniref:ead/Ea22-like family protein n=1 Tax=Escherichia coli TaxID=562 RepID=UPI001296EB0A|nr:ead/Ea22-like family protein [Escherichia coli]
MSNIDKQALREIAAAAVGAHERLSVMPPDDIFDISLAEGTQLDADITALNSLNSAANPTTVLAMLDELEAKDSTIAAQQHEIRMLLNALEEKPCPKCNDTGMADSGGTQPWGEPIEIECDCRQQDANTAELVSTGIITNAGE